MGADWIKDVCSERRWEVFVAIGHDLLSHPLDGLHLAMHNLQHETVRTRGRTKMAVSHGLTDRVATSVPRCEKAWPGGGLYPACIVRIFAGCGRGSWFRAGLRTSNSVSLCPSRNTCSICSSWAQRNVTECTGKTMKENRTDRRVGDTRKSAGWGMARSGLASSENGRRRER